MGRKPNTQIVELLKSFCKRKADTFTVDSEDMPPKKLQDTVASINYYCSSRPEFGHIRARLATPDRFNVEARVIVLTKKTD